jgi:hypothetical protein
MYNDFYKNIRYNNIKDVKLLLEQEQTVRDIKIIDKNNSEFQNAANGINDLIQPARCTFKNMQVSKDTVTWQGSYDDNIEWFFDFKSRKFTITANNALIDDKTFMNMRRLHSYLTDTLSVKMDNFK